jgi:hypothetical protein
MDSFDPAPASNAVSAVSAEAAAPVGDATKPADVVLEGGGVKGIGLAGAII